MNFKSFIVLILICLLLTGCGTSSQGAAFPSTESPPTETTEPSTVPPTEPPETTTPPTEAPDPVLEAGFAIVVDGDELTSGSLIFDESTYVNLGELFTALDGGDYLYNENTGYSLLWNNAHYWHIPGENFLTVSGQRKFLESGFLNRKDGVWVCVEELCALMNISFLPDPAQETLYCTSIAGDWDWPDGIKIPILMYHGVTDDVWGDVELFVSPENMEAHIRYLIENGYDTITFEDWSHLEDFDKPVMLTFDDGYLDNYEELFPILQKYNAKATIFVITTSVNNNNEKTMTSAQAREMMESGLVSIQSHTYSHPHLSNCSAEELQNQMLWSKIHVARMTGYEPFVICYPYGNSDEEARAVAAEHYSIGVNMVGGLCTTGGDRYQIPRFFVSRYTTMDEFIAMVEITD